MSSYREKRQQLLMDTFKLQQKEEEVTTSSTQVSREGRSLTLRERFRRLERVCKKEASRWWEAETLKRYLEVKRIPRGLRLMTFPTDDDADEELLTGWQENFATASENMVKMRIAFVLRCREKHEQEIEKMKQEIADLQAGDVVRRNFEELEKFMTAFQEDLCKKKQTKFTRDDIDYKLGRVYTFARKYDHLYEEDQKEIVKKTNEKQQKEKAKENENNQQRAKSQEKEQSDNTDNDNDDPSSSEVESIDLTREVKKTISKKFNFAAEISRIRRSETFLESRTGSIRNRRDQRKQEEESEEEDQEKRETNKKTQVKNVKTGKKQQK